MAERGAARDRDLSPLERAILARIEEAWAVFGLRANAVEINPDDLRRVERTAAARREFGFRFGCAVKANSTLPVGVVVLMAGDRPCGVVTHADVRRQMPRAVPVGEIGRPPSPEGPEPGDVGPYGVPSTPGVASEPLPPAPPLSALLEAMERHPLLGAMMNEPGRVPVKSVHFDYPYPGNLTEYGSGAPAPEVKITRVVFDEPVIVRSGRHVTEGEGESNPRAVAPEGSLRAAAERIAEEGRRVVRQHAELAMGLPLLPDAAAKLGDEGAGDVRGDAFDVVFDPRNSAAPAHNLCMRTPDPDGSIHRGLMARREPGGGIFPDSHYHALGQEPPQGSGAVLDELAAADAVRFDAIQLHGTEPREGEDGDEGRVRYAVDQRGKETGE